jgi:hypothetical protein
MDKEVSDTSSDLPMNVSWWMVAICMCEDPLYALVHDYEKTHTWTRLLACMDIFASVHLQLCFLWGYKEVWECASVSKGLGCWTASALAVHYYKAVKLLLLLRTLCKGL